MATAALSLVLGGAASAPASAQVLWRGATVGDRADALHRRFPQATPPAHPDILSGGEVEALRLPLASLGGAPATASLFLRDGALAGVELRNRTLPSGASAANLAFAQSVAAEIGREAGVGYDCGATRIAGVSQYTCRWISGDVAIREYYLDVAGQAPVFFVAYRRADDPAFDL